MCNFDDLFLPVPGRINSIRNSKEKNVSGTNSPPETQRNTVLDSNELLTELAKVQETIDNFDKDSENSNDFCSDIKSDTEDHFRSAYPLSESKDDTDKELQNLIDSDEEDEKPEVTLGNIFFQFVFSSQDSHPARSETQSTIGSLRLSLDSDSDEGDIEER